MSLNTQFACVQCKRTEDDLAALGTLLRSLKQQSHAANEWADMATNGMQWIRNIQDGISTPEEALKALQQDLANCRDVQSKADGSLAACPRDLAPIVVSHVSPQVEDERAAWAADMVAAGAQHLGGECWEWDVDDFEFRLWQIARRSPLSERPPGNVSLARDQTSQASHIPAAKDDGGAGGAANANLVSYQQSKRPTPAQLNRLRQVMAGHITRMGESWVSGLYTCRASMGGNPTYVMMCNLQEAGWIEDKCIERKEGRMGSWQIVLTEAGRAVLSN